MRPALLFVLVWAFLGLLAATPVPWRRPANRPFDLGLALTAAVVLGPLLVVWAIILGWKKRDD